MKIGINIEKVHNEITGEGVVTKEVVKRLLRIDEKNEYFLFSGSSLIRSILLREAINQVLVPYSVKKVRIDILYQPSGFIPVFCPCTKVYVLHSSLDTLRISSVPNLLSKIMRVNSIKDSSHLIVVSNYLKNLVASKFKFPLSKISVVYNGVDHSKFHPMNKAFSDRNIQKYIAHDLQEFEHVVLSVPGTFAIHKNLITLLMAFSKLPSSIRHETKLVVVAQKKGELYKTFLEVCKHTKLEKNVFITGYIPHEKMPYLYNIAKVLLHLPLDEAFGLPPLEAMACGVPVIVSKVGGLPEVVGDAGIFTDPTKVTQVANSLEHLLTDPQLRTSLQNRGIARSKIFSWDFTAKNTLRVLEQVFEKKKVS
jgi:glycosyltransferase involved in cell wall biosynthesis